MHTVSKGTFHPRLLLVSANQWSSAGQSASALVSAGFQVGIVCPVESPTYHLRKVCARFPYDSKIAAASTKSAIAAWSPDVLVVADDIAAQSIRKIYEEASADPSGSYNRKLIQLLEFSFGNVSNFVLAQSKSEISTIAASLGIACPNSVVLGDSSDLQIKADKIAYPLIVKTDDAWGGLGVRLVNDRYALRSAIAELSLPYQLPKTVKWFLGRASQLGPLQSVFKEPRKISLQQFIEGHPSTRSVLCWKGTVIAGITVDVLATLHEFGPATLVRVADRPEITAAAEKLAAKFELSGFHGFDFIVDAKESTWFLEMNPRITPMAQFSVPDNDLAGSLFSQISGKRPNATWCQVTQDAFTLFPHQTKNRLHPTSELPSEQGTPEDEPEYVKLSRLQQRSNADDWMWYVDKSMPI